MSSAINLIRDATGPLGDFKLPVCVSLIDSRRISLSDEDVDIILSRYKEHATFWNIGTDAITRELTELGRVVRRDAYALIQRFKVVEPNLWRQYLEPVFQGVAHEISQHEITILDRPYLIDIETQRSRTVMRITAVPLRLLTEADLTNLRNLAQCLSSRMLAVYPLQVWVDMPGVLEEYVRIFARAVAQQSDGTMAFSPVPVAALKLAINECVLTRLGGSYRPSF